MCAFFFVFLFLAGSVLILFLFSIFFPKKNNHKNSFKHKSWLTFRIYVTGTIHCKFMLISAVYTHTHTSRTIKSYSIKINLKTFCAFKGAVAERRKKKTQRCCKFWCRNCRKFMHKTWCATEMYFCRKVSDRGQSNNLSK